MGLGGTLITGVVLWTQAERIGAAVARGADDSSRVSLDEAALLRAGTALIGIWVLVEAFAALSLYESAVFLSSGDPPHIAESRAARAWSRRVATGVEILLGVGLVLGRERIADRLTVNR